MADKGIADVSSQAPISATSADPVLAPVPDFNQPFLDTSMLNGGSLADQTGQSGLTGIIPPATLGATDPAQMNYYFSNSALPPNVTYGIADTWSSGGAQVMDPNTFLPNAPLGGLGGDQQRYMQGDMTSLQFGQYPQYYMPNDASATSAYYTDPHNFQSLYSSSTDPNFPPTFAGSTLDGQPAGTEGLPPVDVAGGLPLGAQYALNTNFSSGIDSSGISDLENSFANVGLVDAGPGTSSGLAGMSDLSSVTSALPDLVDMTSVMSTGRPDGMQPRQQHFSTATPSSSSAEVQPVSAVSSAPHTQPSRPAPSSGPPKPMSWASIASAAPKRQSPTASPRHHPAPAVQQASQAHQQYQQQAQQARGAPGHYAAAQPANSWQQAPHLRQAGGASSAMSAGSAASPAGTGNPANRAPRHRGKPGTSDVGGLDSIEPTETGGLEKLRAAHEYNPKDPNVIKLNNARFFVIKSYSEDDIHRSIKYSIWTSTEHGNKRLDSAYREQKGKPVYLFFSVNGSGHFCGCARMCSEVDYTAVTGVWSQDKWKGKMEVQWIYVKDVPNSQLRHIRLENNENKPVTNSRDTQEIPPDKARQVMKIVHSYRHTTSIFDDFGHYEKRQEESSKKAPGQSSGGRKAH